MARGERVEDVPVKMIEERGNPRGIFDPAKLAALSESIRYRGIREPLILRRGKGEKLEVVSGSRRLRAAKLAGLKTVPAIIRDEPERDAAVDAILVNVQRENLAPTEVAKGYDRLMKVHGWVLEDIAHAVGLEQRTVRDTLSLLTLTDQVLFRVQSGKLSSMHGAVLAKVQSPKEQIKLAKKIEAEHLSAKDARSVVSEEAVTVRRPGRPRKDSGLRAPAYRPSRRATGSLDAARLEVVLERAERSNTAGPIHLIAYIALLKAAPQVAPFIAKHVGAKMKGRKSTANAVKALIDRIQKTTDEKALRKGCTLAAVKVMPGMLEIAEAVLKIERRDG